MAGPNFAQTKVIIETATTIGTKYFAILSANFVSVLWNDWLNYAPFAKARFLNQFFGNHHKVYFR
jgi:hypothetical protein